LANRTPGKHDTMTTVLIILCILLCVGVVLAITGHMGFAIVRDKERRRLIRRHYEERRARRSTLSH
jgi:hypothetical protein